jgi:hypothetical protein
MAMPKSLRGAGVLLVLAYFFTAQVHACLEFDPCLWGGQSSSQNPHGPCGHFCQSGFTANWEPAAAPLQSWGFRVTGRLECEPRLLTVEELYSALPPGRAPPSA